MTVIDVTKGSPAEKAGLKTGDKLISFSANTNTMAVSSPESIQSFVKEHGNNEIRW